MEKIQVTAPGGIVVPPGAIIGDLDDNQVARRRRQLVATSGGRYRVDRAVMFKLGEVLSIKESSLIGRDLWAKVESDGGPVVRKKKVDAERKAAAKKAAKAKAAADKKAAKEAEPPPSSAEGEPGVAAPPADGALAL